jgi:hypothetical protein
MLNGKSQADGPVNLAKESTVRKWLSFHPFIFKSLNKYREYIK